MTVDVQQEVSARDFDEGLGTVYERFMLNDLFDALLASFPIRDVLEIPIYGMTGLTGINSVRLAERGCRLTLVDSRPESVDEAAGLWKVLPHNARCRILCLDSLSELPFEDRSYDLVWNFAALWHVPEPEKLLSEMSRVSSMLVLIVVPNKRQIGYLLRKHFLDKAFFRTIDERWNELEKIDSIMASLGLTLKETGILDVPPWPDTCVPISRILQKLGMASPDREPGIKGWRWDIMTYYLGRDSSLKERVEKFSFIEKMRVPWRLKAFWAHHRYGLFSKN